MGTLGVILAAVTVAWLGWCGVLIRREDVDARLRLADAVRVGEQHRQTVQDMGAAIGSLRDDHAQLRARIEDAERRLQSTIARVGMR